MTDNPELKTIGFTPAISLGNQAMFHVIDGVPIDVHSNWQRA